MSMPKGVSARSLAEQISSVTGLSVDFIIGFLKTARCPTSPLKFAGLIENERSRVYLVEDKDRKFRLVRAAYWGVYKWDFRDYKSVKAADFYRQLMGVQAKHHLNGNGQKKKPSKRMQVQGKPMKTGGCGVHY